MSFKATRITPSQVIAGERLYLNAKQDQIVRDGDPAAAFLLAGAGQPVPARFVPLLGLDDKPAVIGVAPEERSTRPATVRHKR